MKSKRPSLNPQPPQNVRRALENLGRDLAKIGPGLKPLRLPEGLKPQLLGPVSEQLKRDFERFAEAKRAERERELEQEFRRERQEQTKQRSLKRGGRPEKITGEMEQAARAELDRWLGEQNPLPKHDTARDYILDWLASTPRNIKVGETTVRTRIVAPTYRDRRLRGR